jgi:hypothetical protein
MIAKRVAMNSLQKGSFSGLVEYMLDTQNKNERVESVRITNCLSDTPQWAIQEVMATQAKNTRAKTDKTYHMIISFPEGETPSKDVLNAIEDRICDGLGYIGHQRISVIHADTDNLHIHVAINKINPQRHTIHEPYYDHRALGDLCDKLELEYGLQRVNHKPQYADNRVNDMERQAGIESLAGWIKRECLEPLQAAKSWEEMHKALSDNGLEILRRGNGLVIANKEGIAVKASSVSRELSAAKLEAKLGPFRQSATGGLPKNEVSDRPTGQAKKYEQRPLRSRIDTTELYAQYKADQQNAVTNRAAELAKARDRKNRQIEAAKRTGKAKRNAIGLMGKGIGKKLLYSLASRSLNGEFQRINNQYRRERQQINTQWQRQAWADWLRSKAGEGNAEALAALRARGQGKGQGKNLSGSALGGAGTGSATALTGGMDGITKKGTIIYRVGATAIRDGGDNLEVAKGASQADLQEALRMATRRYGDRLTVNGSAEFKAQVVRAAASAKLAITFDDPALEKSRQAYLQSTALKPTVTSPQTTAATSTATTTQGELNEHAADRGRTDPSRVGRTGPIAGTGPDRDGFAFLPRTARGGGKPHVGGVGRKPPPTSQNRLRNLSELGVVRFAERIEMLLPSDVPRHLEHTGTEPNNPVRRDIHRSGMTPMQTAATTTATVDSKANANPNAVSNINTNVHADAYIAEREEKRLKGIDIPQHRHYRQGDEGQVAYAGTRQVGGQSLALLKKAGEPGKQGDEIIVMPIDEATASRMSRLKRGDLLTLKPDGSISAAKTITRKGRSR